MINEDKVKGMMYGLAIGDALGAPTEFMSPEAIAKKYGKVESYIGGGSFGWEPGESTDDTDQAIMLAKSVAGVREPGDIGAAVEDFGRQLVEWAKGAKDIGGQTRLSIETLRDGYPPLSAGFVALMSSHSAGNGSIMRTAPVAVRVAWARIAGNPTLKKLASIFSAVTHAHPTACQTCEILVSLLADLICDIEYDRDALSCRFGGGEGKFTLAEAYETVDGIKDGKYFPGGYSVTTLAWGLWAAEEDKIVYDFVFKPVNMGGDADTNAAVAGAVLGAKLGFEKIPAELVDGLKKRDDLDTAILRLLTL